MQKITILVILSVIAVASAKLCCSPESLSGGEKQKANKKGAAPPVPTTQVLVLKPKLGKDQNLINERTFGNKNLDFTFKCYGGDGGDGGAGGAGIVLAHKSVVVAYSSTLSDLCQRMARIGMQKNEHEVNYPASVIKSLVTLLYEHKVTIEKADLNQVMAAAKSLGIAVDIAPVVAPVAASNKPTPANRK